MARILIYDLETAPDVSYTFGPKWQTNVSEYKRPWYIMSVAWRWLGEEGETHAAILPDFPLYRLEPENDLALVGLIRDLFDEADVTITHNGRTFDGPKAASRMVVHGINPPSPYREIDTLKDARHLFAFQSNRLDDLCHFLGIEGKLENGGFKTWLRCMRGDLEAWELMRRYNKQDVEILERLYLRFRPWIPRHPNVGMLNGEAEACPRCGVVGRMQKRGFRHYTASRRQRYQCMACGGYSLGRKLERMPNEFIAA